QPFLFFYPTFPRVFKNIENIRQAARLLLREGITHFEIRITLDGKKTRYEKWLSKQFSDIPQLKLIGFQIRNNVFKEYAEADCLLFPSKLETWGLPLSEFKTFEKPILAANLPYAHETIGRYDQVKFFNPLNATELASSMKNLMKGQLQFDHPNPASPSPPFATNWAELFKLLPQSVTIASNAT
ncbi:MAG: glycosyltransferase, partial [Proteobacteria bacterium]|nr:glycosyltransferase [Pseudomonadota bacterium]